MTVYRCVGKTRGTCGHKHRTLDGAIKCLERDGANSDRQIFDSNGDRWFQRHDGAWDYARSAK